MANTTDPLVNSLSGSDPQNLFEYILRQKIYDGRYWKEQCFALNTADVLEKAVELEQIGGLPSPFFPLTLKLLQLHPDTEQIVESFIEQEDFRYVRALGCLYVRMTGRPVDIYEALEPCFQDRRKLRVWTSTSRMWSIVHMDEFIDELLTSPRALGIALPRLPVREALQEGGYLPDGPRPTAIELKDGDPVEHLRHKALVEKNPLALEAWKKRNEKLGLKDEEPVDDDVQEDVPEQVQDGDEEEEKRPKKKKKKSSGYGSLFKKDKKKAQEDAPTQGTADENSEEYWNEQRVKLGLKPLKK